MDCLKWKQSWDQNKEIIAETQTEIQSAQMQMHADELFNEGSTIRAIFYNRATIEEDIQELELLFGQDIEVPPSEILDQIPEIIDFSLELSCASGTYGPEL